MLGIFFLPVIFLPIVRAPVLIDSMDLLILADFSISVNAFDRIEAGVLLPKANFCFRFPHLELTGKSIDELPEG